MLAEYRKRRDFVIERLRAIPGVTCAEPKGAFYAYPNICVRVRQERHRQLAGVRRDSCSPKAHVAVVPGEAFGTDEHVRISYATSMQELRARPRPHCTSSS